MDEQLTFNYDRRFGVEIEMNSLDRRDFKANPLPRGELPLGIDYVAVLIEKKLKVPVKIHTWHHTHNNFNEWICKPDSSCGIEVCSPAARGWINFGDIIKVVEVFSQDNRISIDERCSFHIHVNIEDALQKRENSFYSPYSGGRSPWSFASSWGLANLLAYWVKAEPVFLDSVPNRRKHNRYCQCIGMSDVFHHDDPIDPDFLISKLGGQKYFSINTFHLCGGHRPTIEFRIAEEAACSDPIYAKNWIRLILHFVERALAAPAPKNLTWMDPVEVFDFLGFLGSTPLSEELLETRNWFLARLRHNVRDEGRSVMWSAKGRRVAIRQIEETLGFLNINEEQLRC